MTAAVFAVAVWWPQIRCDAPNKFRQPEELSEDGLRHYMSDGCQIDANGYRNRAVPDRSDIVALGDSNTWGVSVYADETWPRILERETKLSVYNISMPAWGPDDILMAMPRALQLKPKFVIVGLYLGNDIYEAYERIARPPRGYEAVAAPFHVPDEIVDDWIWEAAEIEAKVLGTVAWRPWGWTTPEKDSNRIQIVSVNGSAAAVTPRFRLLGVNLAEPRIAYGLTVAKALLATMNQLARQHEARLVVVIQPSKEYVYCGLVAHESMSPEWKAACHFEQRIIHDIGHVLRAESIPYASALEELRTQARRGQTIYPITDAHPNRAGTECIAHAARRAIMAASRGP